VYTAYGTDSEIFPEFVLPKPDNSPA